VKPGGGALNDCVKAHFSDLSADCQVTIGPRGGGWQSLQGRRQEVLRRRQIRQGAIADCMKEHTAEVSDGCKDAMAKAEAGNK
jgi:hypothetical protein